MSFDGGEGTSRDHHKEREAEMDAFVRSTIAQGTPWTDESFPPSQESLFEELHDALSRSELQFYDSLQWRRASEVYSGLKMKEGESYSVSDFSQGQASHNFILAYLRTLPSLNQRIDKVLVTKEVNSACIYRVKFFINGLRTSVIVDDYIPVSTTTTGEETLEKPAFFHSEKQLFWAIIIEKAWAKVNGGYFKIARGTQSFLGIHMTGVPAENINHRDIKMFKGGCWNTDTKKLEKCWKRIVGAFERHYTLEADSASSTELEYDCGILPLKDYSLMGFLVVTMDKHSVHLLHLKNNYSLEEWNKTYSRDSPVWSQKQQQKYYGRMPRGQFYMEFTDFLRMFQSTCINVDAASRAHYSITSAGTNLKDKPDYFLSFTLEEPINCYVDTLGIICEQQGNRIVKSNLPSMTGQKFTPSSFAIMLIYCGETAASNYELVQSTFDSHFKLTLTVHNKTLPPGKYIIMLAPLWHKSANLDPNYKNVRLGIYSPKRISVEKCERSVGYRAIATCFHEVANDTPLRDYQVIKGLPDAFKQLCYKIVNHQPVDGLYGFIGYQNKSKYLLEQKLQVQVDNAVVVWPEDATDEQNFLLSTKPNSTSLILFRKKDTSTQQAKTKTIVLPPVLDEEKLAKLCRVNGTKEYFEEDASSFYQTYQGPGVVVIYFKNKFKNKLIQIKEELTLQNMQVRGEQASTDQLEFSLEPNEGKIVIIDSIERDQPYSFEYEVSYSLIDVEPKETQSQQRSDVER